MADTHLYLSLIPESLIASNLTPSEFGSYMAVGRKFFSRGEALFFEIDPSFESEDFPRDLIEARAQPHADGSPKQSGYLSTYRVLERVPLDKLGALHLTTDDGRVLALQKGEYTPEPERRLHLYQEFAPATPRVASRLSPPDFVKAITDPSQHVSFPRIVFADFILQGLAEDPLGGDIGELPYREINHLRNCLDGLLNDEGKATKNISRRLFGRIHYRTVRSGFFVGDANDFAFYPMPSRELLETEHRDWWRSAQTVSI